MSTGISRVKKVSGSRQRVSLVKTLKTAHNTINQSALLYKVRNEGIFEFVTGLFSPRISNQNQISISVPITKKGFIFVDNRQQYIRVESLNEVQLKDIENKSSLLDLVPVIYQSLDTFPSSAVNELWNRLITKICIQDKKVNREKISLVFLLRQPQFARLSVDSQRKIITYFLKVNYDGFSKNDKNLETLYEHLANFLLKSKNCIMDSKWQSLIEHCLAHSFERTPQSIYDLYEFVSSLSQKMPWAKNLLTKLKCNGKNINDMSRSARETQRIIGTIKRADTERFKKLREVILKNSQKFGQKFYEAIQKELKGIKDKDLILLDMNIKILGVQVSQSSTQNNEINKFLASLKEKGETKLRCGRYFIIHTIKNIFSSKEDSISFSLINQLVMMLKTEFLLFGKDKIPAILDKMLSMNKEEVINNNDFQLIIGYLFLIAPSNYIKGNLSKLLRHGHCSGHTIEFLFSKILIELGRKESASIFENIYLNSSQNIEMEKKWVVEKFYFGSKKFSSITWTHIQQLQQNPLFAHHFSANPIPLLCQKPIYDYLLSQAGDRLFVSVLAQLSVVLERLVAQNKLITQENVLIELKSLFQEGANARAMLIKSSKHFYTILRHSPQQLLDNYSEDSWDSSKIVKMWDMQNNYEEIVMDSAKFIDAVGRQKNKPGAWVLMIRTHGSTDSFKVDPALTWMQFAKILAELSDEKTKANNNSDRLLPQYRRGTNCYKYT